MCLIEPCLAHLHQLLLFHLLVPEELDKVPDLGVVHLAAPVLVKLSERAVERFQIILLVEVIQSF